MSAKTGRAPTRSAAFALETKVKEGQITSWPGPIPSASRASSSAWVQDVVSSTRWAPSMLARRPSTLRPIGPSPAEWLSRAVRTEASSRSSYHGAWKRTGLGAGVVILAAC